MKNLTAKYLSLLMLATLLGSNAQASREDGYMNSGDCCPRQYECGCNPLYCGAWDLQIQAGVNPIIWRNRGPVYGVRCITGANPNPVVTLFDEAPKFSSLYKTPWIVGGQIGYAMSDNTRVYLEFDYSQAKAKSDVVIATGAPTVNGTFTFNFSKYKLFEGYVGARYYWDRWCDHLSFFFGGKVGFVARKRQTATFAVAIPNFTTLTITDQEFNSKRTAISGGGHLGLDYCICGNWSLVLTGEVVASCGPRGIGAIALGTNPNANDLRAIFTPRVGTELRFPVTLAVRYSF